MRRQQVYIPSVEDFRGKPLRMLLIAICAALHALAVSVGVKPFVILVYTPGGGIAARSGTTPGSATCNIVTWNGTALSNSGNGTVTVYNAYSAAFSASKYAWCLYWKGSYWGATQECA